VLLRVIGKESVRAYLPAYSLTFKVPSFHFDSFVRSFLLQEKQREHVEDFLQAQNERVVTIEEDLFEATDHILPASRESKTATELAELCRLVQEATRQKLSLLKTRLELMSGGGMTTIDWKEQQQQVHNPSPAQKVYWSIGGPLECVIEGDVETEGATTPGSMTMPSPFTTAKKQGKKSITPTTPTMDSFSFRYVECNAGCTEGTILSYLASPFTLPVVSASTHSFLETMNIPSGDKKRVSLKGRLSQSPSSRASSRSDRQLNFDGFQEDDSVISLESQSTIVANKSQTSSSIIEERNEFIARMESTLGRVEESILENRPSDETNGTSGRSTSSRRPSNNKFLEELEEEEDFDDDSTNVAPTQVASVNKDKSEPVGQTSTISGQNIQKPVPVFHRPTHILVDTDMPSPTHTNLTMDATMLNDTFLSMSMLADDDNNSTVTPILDRYRLDPDDNSIGIRVVPNKRGIRGGRTNHEIIPEAKTPLPTEYMTHSDGFLSPKGIPGSVSARKKKQYRRTPFPKKQLDDSFQFVDENDDPNVQLNQSAKSSFSVPRSSFSVPPLRPRSFGPARTVPANPSSSSRTLSLPGTSSNSIRAVDGNQGIQKEPSLRMGKWMEKITMAEYDLAPRVVQMQVNRDEANQVLDALEDFLTVNNQTSLEFSQQQGYQVLSKVLKTEQKSKSVLMSLCHWRRLLMYRDKEHGMIFAVNQFEQ
jgi:hypothetical protein